MVDVICNRAFFYISVGRFTFLKTATHLIGKLINPNLPNAGNTRFQMHIGAVCVKEKLFISFFYLLVFNRKVRCLLSPVCLCRSITLNPKREI